jgi:hypothetical protein
MTAGVHAAWMTAGVGKLVVLCHGQGVDVGAQANGARAGPTLNHTHHPGLGQTPMHLNAPGLQCAGNHL